MRTCVLALLTVLALLPSLAFCQGYRGHDFWICFPQNARLERNHLLKQSIFITSDSRTKGSIINMSDTSVLPFSVEAGASMSMDLDTVLQITSNGIVERKAFHVVCDNDITLFVVSHRASSTDSYTAIPTPLLGKEYKAVGYGESNGFESQCEIIATEDNTWVTIRLSSTAYDSMPAGRSIALGLRKGETFQLKSGEVSHIRDLTGTTITADKPIAFVTGHACAQVPVDVRYCDMVMEMEAPSNDYGKSFAIAKFVGKDYSVIRVISNAEDNEITLNGLHVATLNNGGYYECDTLKHDALITTSKPSLVAQYATSSEDDSVPIGDPFMLLVTPTDRFEKSYSTSTVIAGPFLHYLNIVVPRRAVTSLSIDGRFVAPHNELGDNQPVQGITSAHSADYGITFKPYRRLPGGEYVVITEEITAGRHDITCDSPIGVYAYGFGREEANFDSYGHSCGGRLDRVGP